MGQALPSRICVSFVFPFVTVYLLAKNCGEQEKGSPHHNRASWFEVGNGYTLEKPAAAP